MINKIKLILWLSFGGLEKITKALAEYNEALEKLKAKLYKPETFSNVEGI